MNTNDKPKAKITPEGDGVYSSSYEKTGKKRGSDGKEYQAFPAYTIPIAYEMGADYPEFIYWSTLNSFNIAIGALTDARTLADALAELGTVEGITADSDGIVVDCERFYNRKIVRSGEAVKVKIERAEKQAELDAYRNVYQKAAPEFRPAILASLSGRYTNLSTDELHNLLMQS